MPGTHTQTHIHTHIIHYQFTLVLPTRQRLAANAFTMPGRRRAFRQLFLGSTHTNKHTHTHTQTHIHNTIHYQFTLVLPTR